MPTADLITFNQVNKIVETVPSAFNEREKASISWIWRPEISLGTWIRPGLWLADIQWEDNTFEPVAAPYGCFGLALFLNRDIDYLNLIYIEQTLMRVS